MKRIILGVAAALFLSAGQAAADGLPSKGYVRATEVSAVPNWNGFYVGLGIGAGAVVHDVGLDVYGNSIGFDGVGGEGVFGTVVIGYDRVIRPGWVAGVFADYDFGSNIATDVSFSYGQGSRSFSLDQNYTWSVGGRLGFLTNPGTLVYGTAGYTQTEFDFFSLASKRFDGYFVGAGVETFLRPDWTLKLEYRYSQFDDTTLIDERCFNLSVEPSEHTARVVLSYKLGHRD
jgi:outer membrane immunogenic protein